MRLPCLQRFSDRSQVSREALEACSFGDGAARRGDAVDVVRMKGIFIITRAPGFDRLNYVSLTVT